MVARLSLAVLVASLCCAGLGCTVTTGTDARDATYVEAPPRTPASPRRKSQPTVTPRSTPAPTTTNGRTPAVPVRR